MGGGLAMIGSFPETKEKRERTKRACTCQEKVDTEKAELHEAQFGLVLNWAFVAQSGSRTVMIEEVDIAV